MNSCAHLRPILVVVVVIVVVLMIVKGVLLVADARRGGSIRVLHTTTIATVVVVLIFAVVGGYRTVRLLVVRRHGKGSLIRVDVLGATGLNLVVARKATVELEELERVDAEEAGDTEEDAGETGLAEVLIGEARLAKPWDNVPHK